ncbi:phenylpyruvate tautomerase MIF-related protein [Marinilabilia salmonicolor]|uniref:L-dopachrome isomerase n=1 Tax=Marinilabilia salmonicolor TaxID=989 RepID=A0A368VB25_9BACT|nr:phenylpyruvate tautomerase MIF-related protein [Marinilabilia salmonicolor]RCW38312.1 macrophage migration inhibitory factor (MIF) [Marinilabilia salmonicolor]
MPFLKISTNKAIDITAQTTFLKAASAQIAETLQKPEKFVMTQFDQPTPMTFGGTDEDAAFLEIKSIGLTNGQAGILAKEIPTIIENHLGIDASRIYIEFSDAPRSFWGWNKGTF